MFCPKCGKETDASGQFCQWCGAPIETAPAQPAAPAVQEEPEGPDLGKHAGLGRRIVAFIVDAILILLLGIIILAFFNLIIGFRYAYYIVISHAPIYSLTEAGTVDAAVIPIVAAFGLLFFIIPWLYFAGFEASRSHATPGKVLMKVEVTDLEGSPLTFAQATLRHFAKYLSALIIFIGFLMIGLTKKRQGLHDKIAGTYVIIQE